MQKIILVTGLFTVLSSFAFSQCPTAGFSLPDSACAGTAFQVTNTSSVGLNYHWDLCPGDLSEIPSASNLSGQSGLNFPQQMKMVTENGNHYLFMANFLNNNILRYDFGNSVDNIPTVYDYGSIGLLNQPAGLDVVYDNGNWYALVCSYSQNNIIRVDFGTTIANNSATAANLGLFNLSTPKALKIVKDVNDYYALVSNSANNDLTKISFGNSIANTPGGFTALTNPAFDNNWGIDAIYDCSINKWLVLYATNTLSKINIIDFGNSLGNTGTLVSSISCVPNPTGISINRDGSKWHVFVNSITTLEFQNIQFSGSLLNAPSLIQTYNNFGLTSPRYFSVFRDSFDVKVFISLNQPDNIKTLVFEKTCGISPPVSSNPVGVSVTSNLSNLYQHISLEVTGLNGEKSYYDDSIFVEATPLAGFLNTAACDGQPVIFTDTSQVDTSLVTSWLWDFGDGTPTSNDQNPLHTFPPGTGNYNVTLITSYPSGCSDDFTAAVTVNPLPAASYSFNNNQCTGVPVQFTDLSQAFGGASITSWLWNFGDTTDIDTLQNPVHIFTAPGVYNVILTVISSTGCVDTVFQSITILAAPVAGFTIDETCVGETVSFNNTTAISGGGTINYNWDFGDTFNSVLENPTHQYASVAGNYDVTLIATASNGCADTLTLDVRIADKPVPQFNWTPQIVCKSNTVTFTSTSTGSGNDTIAAYMWDFGDSNFSTDVNPFHAFADTGIFNITLTVMSLTACDSSITQQLYVIPSPTASFTANNVCLGLTTTFNPLTSTPPSTQIDSIVWTFGDGSTFTGLNSPVHEYTVPDIYEVTMTVYNDLLCTATFVDSVEVFPIPVAAFTTSILCSDSLTTFNGTLSSVINDSITSWIWNYGGLGSGTGSISQFAFPDSGTFDVALIVTTQHGCQDTTQQSLQVILSPEFNFSFNESCIGSVTNFIYIPNLNPPPNAILSWDFGDGTTSPILSPNYIYTTVDTFNVSLRVQHNSTGCASTVNKMLIIHPYPVSGFVTANNCENFPVQFIDTSSIITGTITSWNWDFENLGSDTTENTEITLSNPGTYPVSLTVTSGQGCSSTSSSTFTVYANPIAQFSTDPLYGSPPLTVNYINTTTGGNSYFWEFGDGFTSTLQSPSHVYQDTGNYSILLVATSLEGCLDSSNSSISILFPYLDVAVNKVYSAQNNDLFKITAEIQNNGNIPVTTMDINGLIENGSSITENWSGILQPGQKLIYEFSASYYLISRINPGFYCVEALNPNNGFDENSYNNSKCAVTGTTFEVYSIYPNPFNDQITVSFNLPLEEVYSLRIHDALGKTVYKTENQNGFKGYNKLTIPTVNFSKGVFAISIEYRNEIKVKSIVNY